MEESIIQINGGIIIKVNVSVKDVMYMKNIMFGILVNVVVKMGNMDDSAITWDEVRELYDEETNTIPKIFNDRKASLKRKISLFYLHFNQLL